MDEREKLENLQMEKEKESKDGRWLKKNHNHQFIVKKNHN